MTGDSGAPPPDEPQARRSSRPKWFRPLALIVAVALIVVVGFFLVDPFGAGTGADK